jgi:hypothetical protein
MTKNIALTAAAGVHDVRKLVSVATGRLANEPRNAPRTLARPVACDVGATRVELPIADPDFAFRQGERLIATTTIGDSYHGAYSVHYAPASSPRSVPRAIGEFVFDVPLAEPATLTAVRRPTTEG